MNIKMPADCFTPRLVTENALGSRLGTSVPDSGSHADFSVLNAADERISDLPLAQTHDYQQSALDLLAKNQVHIASDIFQQFLASDANLGAKLHTLQQVNEQTASHLGSGCAGQAPRLCFLLENPTVLRAGTG
jgi:hypothetical protein